MGRDEHVQHAYVCMASMSRRNEYTASGVYRIYNSSNYMLIAALWRNSTADACRIEKRIRVRAYD